MRGFAQCMEEAEKSLERSAAAQDVGLVHAYIAQAGMWLNLANTQAIRDRDNSPGGA